MSKVIEFIEKGKIFEITPDIVGRKNMTKEEMVAIFNYLDAFWEYKGEPNPEKPHAMLASGKHSNGFIPCKKVLQYVQMNKLFAYEIFKDFIDTFPNERVDVVVSSAYSAITLGYEVARLLSSVYPKIEYIIVEKDKEDKPTKIRGGIDPSKTVLIVNELMTTKEGSTWETKEAVLKCNGSNPAPKIIDLSFVLVHRSKDHVLEDGSKVYAIFHFDIEDWDPAKESCPYCKSGSKAIKPKENNNWNILHGRGRTH